MDFFSDFFGMEGGIALFYGIYLLIVWAFGIASYVLRALGWRAHGEGTCP